MEIEKVKNTPKEERKLKTLSVRISNSDFEFLKTNQLSITKIANEAIRELREKIEVEKKKQKSK